MNGGLLGSVIGAALGVAGGTIGAYVGFRRSRSSRESGAVVRMLIVLVAAIGLALIAGFYGPIVLRVIAAVLLAVIAFVLSMPWAGARGENAGRRGQRPESR